MNAARHLRIIALLTLVTAALRPVVAQHPAPAASLARLLSCHDSAVGGPALRAIERIELELAIEEPTYSLTGLYTATRSGSMRIDVFAKGQRVFSEGLLGTQAWERGAGAADSVLVGGDAAAALRRGLEQPGHFWTLADMPRNGHRVELAEPDASDPTLRGALKLTMRDGFEQWYWLDPETCLITRQRNFRAFHPTADSARKWVETHFTDYQRRDGVLRAMTTLNIDVATGDTIGRTRVTAVRQSSATRP